MLIGSHNLLAAPSRRQLDDATLRPLIDEFLHGAKGVDAEERAALFRLAWDFVGSSLAGRNVLYERFYLTSAGAQPHQPPPPEHRPQPRLRARRRDPGGGTPGGPPGHACERTRLAAPGGERRRPEGAARSHRHVQQRVDQLGQRGT